MNFISRFFQKWKEVTMNELHLISPIPPSVNHYMGIRSIMKNGKPMAMTYKTPEAVKYQKDFAAYVRREVQKQGWDVKPNKTQHWYVDAWFYFNRIDMDAANYDKCLLDAITDTQLIWLDDNVVCERVQKVLYDSQNPRIELHIHPVDYIGIFEDITALEKFENRCIGCTRYARNCSLLQKAIEGRVQDEIHDGVCLCYRRKGE